MMHPLWVWTLSHGTVYLSLMEFNTITILHMPVLLAKFGFPSSLYDYKPHKRSENVIFANHVILKPIKCLYIAGAS